MNKKKRALCATTHIFEDFIFKQFISANPVLYITEKPAVKKNCNANNKAILMNSEITFDTEHEQLMIVNGLPEKIARIAVNPTEITAFQHSNKAPQSELMTTEHLISSNDSSTPIYLQKDGTTLKQQSKEDKVTAGEKLYCLFAGNEKEKKYFENLTDISGLKDQDTSNVKSMQNAFSNCKSLNDLSALVEQNTENVTNMSEMFDGCQNLTNTSDLSSQNTKNVTDMSQMFCNCKSLTTIESLSSQNTENVVNMAHMFHGCENIINLDKLALWNTGSVTDMWNMFSWCYNLTNLDGLSAWDTKNVTDTSQMFWGCVDLVDASAINNQNILNVTNFDHMFSNCKTHPEFSARAGNQDNGTFTPST